MDILLHVHNKTYNIILLVITFFDKEDCICHKNSPSIPPQPNYFYLTEKSKFNLGNTGQY